MAVFFPFRDIVGQFGRGMVIGTVVLVAAAVLGWFLGRPSSFLWYRLLAWWIEHIVLPLLRARSWMRRTATIFANNTVVLAALLALGRWPLAARIGVVVLGLNLGAALRHLSLRGDVEIEEVGYDRRSRRIVLLGVALNMLEAPAIVMTIGLALGRGTVPLSADQAWAGFAIWVIPALAIAAAGEALWLGVRRPRDVVPEVGEPNSTDHDEPST